LAGSLLTKAADRRWQSSSALRIASESLAAEGTDCSCWTDKKLDFNLEGALLCLKIRH
jgi:hypothetical protein